jgi:predicted Rossmann fold flavoprotein
MKATNMAVYDVVVIGGGPAGAMAAVQAAKRGFSVMLFDRNARIGKKLSITGKGRCNLTNNCTKERLFESVRRNYRFLFSAFSGFTPQDTMQFFENLNVPLKTERGGRVFPQSDKAIDIVAAMENFLKELGVEICRGRVSDVSVSAEKTFMTITTDGKSAISKCVILCTGGLSYPTTGSTGDGYQIALKHGHTIMTPMPSLVGIEVMGNWCTDLMGLSLKNVALTLKKKSNIQFHELGEMMFTQYGVSGPLVLTASSYIDGNIADYSLHVDFKPGLTHQQLDNRILRDFDQSSNRQFKNSLGQLLPIRLIPIVVNRSGIDPNARVHSITREQRTILCNLLKDFTIEPKKLRPLQEAVVTRGGIKISEVDPKTMQSKLVDNLYFAGEILDLDAITGGFNLQIAFSTGYVAGTSAMCNKTKGNAE